MVGLDPEIEPLHKVKESKTKEGWMKRQEKCKSLFKEAADAHFEYMRAQALYGEYLSSFEDLKKRLAEQEERIKRSKAKRERTDRAYQREFGDRKVHRQALILCGLEDEKEEIEKALGK